MGTLTLILGGARSGKSTYAEKLARERGDRILYIATAEALDREMRERIQKHRAERPGEWVTRELSHGVGTSLRASPPAEDTILLDCMTLLVSNIILAAGEDIGQPDEHTASLAVEEELNQLLDVIRDGDQQWIIVSNEVGLGLVPPYPVGRLYRDILGRVNRLLAEASEEVYFLTAGMVLPLHDLARRPD